MHKHHPVLRHLRVHEAEEQRIRVMLEHQKHKEGEREKEYGRAGQSASRSSPCD